jgi:hypothetical protein
MKCNPDKCIINKHLQVQKINTISQDNGKKINDTMYES